MANMNKKSLKQGKTKKQYENSAKATFYGWCGVLIMVVILALFSLLTGCTTTKKIDKCCDKEHVITEWDGDRQINWYSSSEEK